MANSIIQTQRECYLCRRLFNIRTPYGLEEHHIFGGNGRRAVSERYGLTVYLCKRHHNVNKENSVHFNPELAQMLHSAAQIAFESRHAQSFLDVFDMQYLG